MIKEELKNIETLKAVTISNTAVFTEGKKFNLNYLLTITEKEIEDSGKTVVYGIKAESINEHGIIIDEITFYDISSNIETVTGLIEKLKKGRATPSSIKDIIDDYIG